MPEPGEGAGAPGEPASRSTLAPLLALQARDTELDQLRHRRSHLPARAELDAVDARLAALTSEVYGVAAERAELARRQAQLEADLAEAEKRLEDIDRRMRSGTVSASRDLQAMADQVTSLKRRRSDLEDAELEVMEAIDPLDTRLAELAAQQETADAEAVRLRREVAGTEASIDAEVAAVTAARSEAVTAVLPSVIPTYERLRQRLGGVGAAELVGSSCGGCHLTLSAAELDRIHRSLPDAVVTCEQCGRILVR